MHSLKDSRVEINRNFVYLIAHQLIFVFTYYELQFRQFHFRRAPAHAHAGLLFNSDQIRNWCCLQRDDHAREIFFLFFCFWHSNHQFDIIFGIDFRLCVLTVQQVESSRVVVRENSEIPQPRHVLKNLFGAKKRVDDDDDKKKSSPKN